MTTLSSGWCHHSSRYNIIICSEVRSPVEDTRTYPVCLTGDNESEMWRVVGRLFAESRAAFRVAQNDVHDQLEALLAAPGRRYLQRISNNLMARRRSDKLAEMFVQIDERIRTSVDRRDLHFWLLTPHPYPRPYSGRTLYLSTTGCLLHPFYCCLRVLRCRRADITAVDKLLTLFLFFKTDCWQNLINIICWLIPTDDENG